MNLYEILIMLVGVPDTPHKAFVLFVMASVLTTMFIFSTMYLFISVIKLFK